MNSPPTRRLFPPWAQKERESERQTAQTTNKGHGRVETRELTTSVGLNEHLDWPGVGQVCRIHRERRIGKERQQETAYFVTSLTRDQADAERLLELSRRHWGCIENGLHYVRDKTLDEDRCTIFRGHAPQNLAAFRNAALNWLRQLGVDNMAATIRSFTRKPQRLFTRLGIVN
jgi:predicted transposase YbfD/YdcC